MFSCLLMVLLAINLPALQMRPGESFTLQSSEPVYFDASRNSMESGWSWILIQGLVIALFILLPVYIVIGLLSEEGRKKLLANVLLITLILLFVMWLSNINLPPTLQPGSESLSDPEFDTVTSPNFVADPEPWMLPLIITAAAVLLTFSAFLAKKFLSNRMSSEKLAYMDIADHARKTLDEIEEAKISFDDVIIRCYVEMNHTLQDEKGIHRAEAVTTNEFQQELLARGFPSRPVKRLTQLFEQVRYGRQQIMDNEKQVAVDCLGEIIDYCRGQA